MSHLCDALQHRRTNSRRLVARAIEFCKISPDILRKKLLQICSLHTKMCISSHETEKKASDNECESPEWNPVSMSPILTLKSLAMAPRFLEKFHTLGLYRNCEKRAHRLCTFFAMAVVISDFIAPMASDKVNSDLN